MGVVTQLVHRDDKRARSVFVRTPGGQINHYSIKHLYPLELSLTHSGNNSSITPSSSPSTSSTVPAPAPSSSPAVANSSKSPKRTSRPVRQAALAARVQFKESDSDSEEDLE